jgi:hypothetical protein
MVGSAKAARTPKFPRVWPASDGWFFILPFWGNGWIALKRAPTFVALLRDFFPSI